MEYIYTVSCPVSEMVVYVGKSCQPRIRFYEHCTKNNYSLVSFWCLCIRSIGLEPVFRIIDEAERDNIFHLEKGWIMFFKLRGEAFHNRASRGQLSPYTLWARTPKWVQERDLQSIEIIKQQNDYRHTP